MPRDLNNIAVLAHNACQNIFGMSNFYDLHAWVMKNYNRAIADAVYPCVLPGCYDIGSKAHRG